MGGDSSSNRLAEQHLLLTFSLLLEAIASKGHPALVPGTRPHASLTQHCDRGVTFLGGVGVELAEVSTFIRNRDICQRHFEFTARKIQQLKPAVLQGCETKHRGSK